MGDTAGTTLEAPAPASPPARERRWGLIALVIGLAVIATAAVVSRLVWAASYAPLVGQGVVSVQGSAYVAEDPAPNPSGPDPAAGRVVPRFQLPFVPGATHTMDVWVRNDGPEQIEVLGVVPDGPLPLLPLKVVDGRPLSDVGGRPMSWPQMLQPGDSVLVEFGLVIGSCHSSGNGNTQTTYGLSLRTRTLWFEQQDEVTLDTPVTTTVDQSHCTG